jgi:hypothetical protein
MNFLRSNSSSVRFDVHFPLVRRLQQLAILLLLPAIAQATGQLRLQWQDNATNEIGYRVLRWDSDTQAYVLIATLPANTTSYTDTTVTPGEGYAYRVQAYNDSGTADSNDARAIAKTSQTVTLAALPTATFGDAPFTASAAASSGLTSFSFGSSNSAVATVSGNTVTIVGTGTTNITGTQAGDDTYAPASDTQTLTVNQAGQTITFGALPNVAMYDPPFTLSAIASSGLPVAYASSNTAVAAVSGSTVTIIGIGTTTITATQPGNSNYIAAANVAQTLTVTKADQTITFDPLPTKTVGDPTFTLTATSSSGLPISYGTSNPNVASVSGSTVTIVNGGSADITAKQNGNATYNAATPVVRTLVVYKAPVFASQPANRVITAGSNTTFNIQLDGRSTAPFVYKWQISTDGGVNWSDLTIASPYTVSTPQVNASTLTVSGATASLNGNLYRCIATNNVGSATSNGGSLTVNWAPSFTTQPANQSTVAGGNASFTIATTGNPTPTYQWQISTTPGGSTFTNLANDGTYSGVTTATLTITSASSSLNNFRYRAVAFNSVVPSGVNSAYATLTVQ